jgi:hypothetical protein
MSNEFDFFTRAFDDVTARVRAYNEAMLRAAAEEDAREAAEKAKRDRTQAILYGLVITNVLQFGAILYLVLR